MSPPPVIAIEASLECELDGQPLTVDARRGVIVISVASPKMARQLISQTRRLGKLRSTVARLNAALLSATHRLELHVDRTVVASMGHGTDSGLLRLAGLPHLRVWPLRLLQRSSSD